MKNRDSASSRNPNARDEGWQRIRDAFHGGEFEKVRELIPKYLSTRKIQPEARYEASDFYRGLGDYAQAIRLLPKERPLSQWPRLKDSEQKLQIQLMRMLNLMGASRFALRILDFLSLEDKDRHLLEVSEILISNYRYAEFLACLPKGTPPQAKDTLFTFYQADALAGTGQFKVAFELVEPLAQRRDSQLLQSIALQVQGEYLVRSGQPGPALDYLMRSQSLFRDDDRTNDHGLLKKWLGICLGLLGEKARSEVLLRESLEILYRPNTKPEGWYEVLLWQDRISGSLAPGGASPGENTLRILAISAIQPMSMPGLPIPADQSPDPSMIFRMDQLGGEAARYHIDRRSDLVTENGRVRFGTDRVDDLLCLLVYAGKYGLPQYRIYELLWPEELFSFQQFKKRLEQLVHRARERGFEIEWDNLHLWLRSTDISCTSPVQSSVPGYAFLEENAEFLRADVQSSFNISQTVAIELCRIWLEKELVSRDPSHRYRSKVS